MIRQLNKKDKLNFLDYCSQFGNNLFTDCSFKILEFEFNNLIRLNTLCLIDEEYGKIRGVLFLEKLNGKNYIKTIYDNPQVLDRLLNVLIWNFKKDLILIINDYKTVSTIKKYYFKFSGKENDKFVYIRKYYQKER